MRNFNANPMILFSKETDENWQCYCTITRYSWNRRIWKYCDVTIITRVTRVNLRVTRNPHWGYGLGKGSKNSTRTPTRVYPTRDPCGFQNPWQSLMTTTPSTTPPPPVPPSLQPTLKPLNTLKWQRQQQQRLDTQHVLSHWYVFFLSLFYFNILMFILDISIYGSLPTRPNGNGSNSFTSSNPQATQYAKTATAAAAEAWDATRLKPMD